MKGRKEEEEKEEEKIVKRRGIVRLLLCARSLRARQNR